MRQADMRSLMQTRCWLTLAATLLASATLLADDTLTRLVPADVGICLELHDLAQQADEFASGPLFARWQAFPPLALWNEKNLPALQKIFAEIDRQLGVEVSDAWQHALGRRSLLAVWPPQAGDPVPTQGLLLVEADDELLIPRLLDGLRRAQEQAGELSSFREEVFAGAAYRVHSVQRGGTQSQIYLAAAGRLGVLASHEHLMRRVLELRAGVPAKAPDLAASAAYRAASACLEPGACVRLFVNPRAWDAALQSIPPSSNRQEARSQEMLKSGWSAMRFAASSLRLTPHPTWEFFVQCDGLPAASPLADLLDSFSGAAGFLERVPADCLLAIALQVDVRRLMRRVAMLETGADEANERPNGAQVVWNLLDQLLAGAGPGAGAALLPAGGESRDWPFDLILGIQTRSRPEAARQPSDDNLHETLRTLLLLAAALQSLQPDALAAEVRTVQEKERKFTQVTQVKSLPAEMTATFALVGNHLLFGTSLDCVARAADLPRAESLVAASPSVKRAGKRIEGPGQIVYVNFAAGRRFVKAHAERLAARVAESKGIPAEMATLGLNQLHAVLELADEALFAARIDRTGIAVTATLSAE